MDRKLFYPLQIPLCEEFLQSEQNALVGLGYLARAVFGSPTLCAGLDCTPTSPTSLTVQISPGQIYALANLDTTGFGSLPGDTHQVIKQGINPDTQAFTLVPPGTSGQAINYLIQAQIQETDTDNIALPYVNTANPSQPFTGPNNSGTQQSTTRKLSVLLSAKAGTAATAGSQVTPSPDAGYVGLYSVTVAYGATTLDTTTIKQLDTAPFLFKRLPEIPSWVQSGAYLWGDDTGTANAIVAKLAPIPTQYTKGMLVAIKKGASANSGNVTINLTGPNGAPIGAVALLDTTGAQIGAGNLLANMTFFAVYNGAAFIWLNGAITNTSISSITATSGEGILVGGSSPFPVSLNFPGLSSGVPTALDLFAFYDNEGTHHLTIKWQDLLALIGSVVPTPTLASIAPNLHLEVQRGGSVTAPSFGSKGVWVTRIFTNKIAEQIAGASVNLGNGQITLPAGTYRGRMEGAAYDAGCHRSRFYNVSDSVEVGHGLDMDSHSGSSSEPATCNSSPADFRFTIAATKVFVMQHINRDGNVGSLGETSDISPDYHTDAYVVITKEA